MSRRKDQQTILNELVAEEYFINTPERSQSRAVEALVAMKRIKEGTYGICVDCDKKIPAARLQAKPEATRCVNCQELKERKFVA